MQVSVSAANPQAWPVALQDWPYFLQHGRGKAGGSTFKQPACRQQPVTLRFSENLFKRRRHQCIRPASLANMHRLLAVSS
jgi:hypothetical protein